MVSTVIKIAVSLVWVYCCFALIAPRILHEAYDIRLEAIKEYGPIIHEFDPYFNFRATEYLYQHGAKKFFQWFDYMVWYPLGRPVGTTIYPGMQFTSVFIKKYIMCDRMSLNDICCYVPAWFGVLATFFTGLMAYECTLACNCSNPILDFLWKALGMSNQHEKDATINLPSPWTSTQSYAPVLSFICAMAAMSVIPAHLMRSVGGGYDNESVAMTAMSMTFYLWTRSLRSGEDKSYLWGIATGFAYFYMVATWGGYVFVLNMIGLHAALLVLLGRFSTKVYLAYSIFYVVGTSLAIQIPVVGWSPLKSLEQLGAFAIFVGYQVLQYCQTVIRKKQMTRKDAWKFRVKVAMIACIIGLAVVVVFTPTGYFGPISSRVRGLFVKHTKTGNPLVDSVAEHQPARANSYFQYLQHFCTIAPIGFIMTFIWFGDSPSFVAAYGVTAYFFSHKMVRLILLMAPVTSVLGGIALGRVGSWCLCQFFAEDSNHVSDGIERMTTSKKKRGGKGKSGTVGDNKVTESTKLKWPKRLVAIGIAIISGLVWNSFHSYCWRIGKHLSHPSIIQVGQTRDGKVVYVDDYREAYNWIRENTPEDSRIMAWWDYGYQITSIANRTTIADGNTWNHEHIALLARIFTGPVEEGYKIARHLADYILVWAGGGGDDLAKSPHLARIANSVYRNMCSDPVCSKFTFIQSRQGRVPSPQMTRSLVNHLVSNKFMPDIEVDPSMFQEVFRSKYGKVRVYKIMGVDEESKNWVADPKNRNCDVEGGWFCRGQYPPALHDFLKEGKDFAQLEDFNKKGYDEDYVRQYFDGIHKKEGRTKKSTPEEEAPNREL
mmetsp:Transcript_17029/g.32223  ORF Transcript_17029/g.32223 Transcript_17029/m.32223 type:complete len:828 (+) Transcript_17029:233-2716(+)